MTNTQASARSSTARNSRRGRPVPQTVTVGGFGQLGFMQAADQRCRHMAVLGMIIVARAIKIGRHQLK